MGIIEIVFFLAKAYIALILLAVAFAGVLQIVALVGSLAYKLSDWS